MSAEYKILKPADIDELSREKRQFSIDVLHGLSESPKRLPAKYHYDSEGSRLFQRIMDLPEYYPTGCEFEILEMKKEVISKLINNGPFNLVELGAGDGAKTKVLLKHFAEDKLSFQYVPIDISESAMEWLVSSIESELPQIEVKGIVSDYFDGLKWLSNLDDKQNLVLFLGSNLGNFNAAHARVFLRSLWNTLNHDDLVLIGFDLKKDIDLMIAAYNDSRGVTAEFNLNLLKRINHELGGDFELNKFRHYATYEVESGAIESHLVSLEPQSVFIKEIGQIFHFDAWEHIHTEYSYKYLKSDIEKLAEETGYVIVEQLFDSKMFFVDSIWKVEKQETVE
jgi:dimethylhistidine N-methyltransferase